MNPRWLFRAKRWAQNPPSAKKVAFTAAIIGLCLLLFLFESFFGWPAWLTPNNMSRIR